MIPQIEIRIASTIMSVTAAAAIAAGLSVSLGVDVRLEYDRYVYLCRPCGAADFVKFVRELQKDTNG